MDFLQKLTEDLTGAMKARDELVLSVLRMMKSAVKNAEIAKRGDSKGLTDEDIVGVLSTMVKQRRESAEQYEKAGRKDLADKETSEVGIIQRYLPQQLDPEELDAVITESIRESGVTGPKEMGKLMKVLMPKVKGKAEGKVVNERVKALLEQMG